MLVESAKVVQEIEKKKSEESKNNNSNDVHDIKIESYLIVDKLRDIDDAVDKLSSKTFLVKMERVFSQDNDHVDKPLPF